MCNGNYGYNCGCGGVVRDCHGNVVNVPAPGLPTVPTTCPTTNGQTFLSSDKSWIKVQGHLKPVIDPTTVNIGQSAVMVAATIVTVVDGLPCDDGHLVQITATDPNKNVSVIVRLIAGSGGAQTIHLTGLGAFGVQGQNLTLRWIEALHGYIIVESYTANGATSAAKSYYEETHLDRLTPYAVQHNLGLTNPKAYILEIRDANTGDTVDIAVKSTNANQITLLPGVTEIDVHIKVLAL